MKLRSRTGGSWRGQELVLGPGWVREGQPGEGRGDCHGYRYKYQVLCKFSFFCGSSYFRLGDLVGN